MPRTCIMLFPLNNIVVKLSFLLISAIVSKSSWMVSGPVLSLELIIIILQQLVEFSPLVSYKNQARGDQHLVRCDGATTLSS